MSAVPEQVLGSSVANNDADPQETQEWLEALESVIGPPI